MTDNEKNKLGRKIIDTCFKRSAFNNGKAPSSSKIMKHLMEYFTFEPRENPKSNYIRQAKGPTKLTLATKEIKKKCECDCHLTIRGGFTDK